MLKKYRSRKKAKEERRHPKWVEINIGRGTEIGKIGARPDSWTWLGVTPRQTERYSQDRLTRHEQTVKMV